MTTANYFQIGSEIARGDEKYVMSRTELLMFNKCPDAWYKGRTFEGNDSTEFGSLVDTLLLTPAEFDSRYEIKLKTYPSPTKADPLATKKWNGNAKWCKNFIEEAKRQTKEVITEYELNEGYKAIKQILDNNETRDIVNKSDKQVVCRWEYTDERTGIKVPLKCMLDLVGTDQAYIGDLKTCRDGSLDGFSRHGKALRYDVQVSFYAEGFRQCYEDRKHWIWVCVENAKPYPVSAYRTTIAQMDITGRFGKDTRFGRVEGYEEMLRHYCHCLATQKWPSYNGGNVTPLEFHF